MENFQIYDSAFYATNRAPSYNSAKVVINILRNYIMPTSVFDLGCGIGTWLKAWQEAGVQNILGMDSNTMPDQALLVPRNYIKIVDFEKNLATPGKFDLSMSLECLEHVSETKALLAAEVLASTSDILLFSAAIPHQVGTNHINCHPLQYWTDIFSGMGFCCYDFIRPRCIEYNLTLDACYLQNILVFAKNEMGQALEMKGATKINKPVCFYHSDYVNHIINKYKKYDVYSEYYHSWLSIAIKYIQYSILSFFTFEKNKKIVTKKKFYQSILKKIEE